jgi:hypothetical protein
VCPLLSLHPLVPFGDAQHARGKWILYIRIIQSREGGY